MNATTTTETTYRAVLGAILANRRTALGLKQEDVAKAAGLSTPTWSRIEKGENPLTTEQLRRVGSVLKVSASALIRLEEDAVKELEERGTAVREELSIELISSARAQAADGRLLAAGGAAVGAASAATLAARIGAGTAAGAAAGFAVPVVGNILGALIGGLGAYIAWQAAQDAEEIKDKDDSPRPSK